MTNPIKKDQLSVPYFDVMHAHVHPMVLGSWELSNTHVSNIINP